MRKQAEDLIRTKQSHTRRKEGGRGAIPEGSKNDAPSIKDDTKGSRSVSSFKKRGNADKTDMFAKRVVRDTNLERSGQKRLQCCLLESMGLHGVLACMLIAGGALLQLPC